MRCIHFFQYCSLSLSVTLCFALFHVIQKNQQPWIDTIFLRNEVKFTLNCALSTKIIKDTFDNANQELFVHSYFPLDFRRLIIVTRQASKELILVIYDLVCTLSVRLQCCDAMIEQISPHLAAQETCLVNLVDHLLFRLHSEMVRCALAKFST